MARQTGAQQATIERVMHEFKAGERTRAELYAEARKRGVPGRSGMGKAVLARALNP